MAQERDESDEPNSMRRLARDMPTPTSVDGAFALFAALELAQVEDGTQTLDDAKDTLRKVFGGEPDSPAVSETSE